MLELVFVAVLLGIASIFVFVQINNLKTAGQDVQRKTAINAMYYALEEVYYKEHNSYPQSLTASTLPSVDPNLFTDPDGFTLGEESLNEEEMQKLIDKGKASDSLQKRLDSLVSGKSPNYHYDSTDCDTSGNCKGYKLRADLVNEEQYVKTSRNN